MFSERVDVKAILGWCRTVEVTVVQLDFTELTFRAQQQLGPVLSEGALVAFVRHQLTNYEALLEELGAFKGRRLAYRIIRNRVLDQVAAVYPALSWWCGLQKKPEV